MENCKEKINKKVLVYGAIWGLTYIGGMLVVKKLAPSVSVGILLSFLPTLTFSLFIYHYIKNLNVMDEVERRIQLEATVWGFTLGILLLMTLGLLEFVITIKKSDWGYTHLIPYFFLFYVVGIIISKRKYFGK